MHGCCVSESQLEGCSGMGVSGWDWATIKLHVIALIHVYMVG